MTATVDVYWLDLDAIAADGWAAAALTNRDERRRASVTAAMRGADRFAAGRHALRAAVGRRLNIEPGRVRFATEPGGRPVPAGGPPPWFSLSHCGGHGVIAIADTAIGIDLERVRPFDELAGPLRDALTAEACATVAGLHGALRDRAATALWTVHEAIVKAAGTTLAAAPPPDLAFDPSGRVVAARSAGRTWHVVELDAPTGHVATLAGDTPVRPSAPILVKVLSATGAIVGSGGVLLHDEAIDGSNENAARETARGP